MTTKRLLSILLTLCLLAATLPGALAEEIPLTDEWDYGEGGADTPDDFPVLDLSQEVDPAEADAGESEASVLIDEAADEPVWDEAPTGEDELSQTVLADIAPDEEPTPLPDGTVQETAPTEEYEEETVWIDAGQDSDELFAGYANRILYSRSSMARRTMATSNAGAQLTGQNATIYGILKPEILRIAAGERTSTEIKIPLSDFMDKTRYTAAELGVTVSVGEDGAITQESQDALNTAYSKKLTYTTTLIANALWLDCTYELYWLDRYNEKVHAFRPSTFLNSRNDAGEYEVYPYDNACITLQFPVLKQYADSDNNLILNTALIQSAKDAADNARAIVAKYSGESTYVKLYGFAKEICDLVDYNNSATYTSWDITVQDPWKLIWVFDGDSDTNVVCEGYSQAFQYLCELAGLDCRLATGYVLGGAHSWNIVTMDDGKNYLVDVTWLDSSGDLRGLTGAMADWISQEKGGLFLVGASSGSVSDGYTVLYRNGKSTSQRSYRKEDTLALYPESALTLAGSKYVPTGWQTIQGEKYYFDENGHYLTGIQKLGDDYFEFSDSGRLLSSQLTGWHTIDGQRLFFEADGKLHTQHTTVNDAAVAPTCTETGLTAGSHCSVCDEVLTARETVPAAGHQWGSVSYTWSADNRSVTARRVCAVDGSHAQTETVRATAAVARPATCTAKGQTTYTATFANAAFAPQSKTIEDIPATGHHWRAPTYTWSADNRSVTAKRVCLNDAGHAQTETVRVTATVTRAATCTANGQTTYKTAGFSNAAFAAQTKSLDDIPATGHTAVTDGAVAPTCTASGLTEGSHCAVCGAVLAAQSPIPATGHTPVGDPGFAATYAATGLTDGSHCGVCGEILAAQEVIPVLDPSFHIKKSTSKSVNVGDPIQIVVDGQDIKSCKSSDKKVASVNSRGLVTAKAAGTAKITITLKNKKKLTLTVKVIDPYAPKKISIVQGKSATMKKGKKLALETTLSPDGAKSKLTWTTSSKSVATVSKTGVVTAKKAGKATITVTTANGKKATIKITVKKK